jgi:hypothetical protein
MANPCSRALAFPLVLVAVAGCKSTGSSADLAWNPNIYRSAAFVSKLPGDLPAFVAPVADERRPEALPAKIGSSPVIYDADGRWERPVHEMVDDVLRQELATSLLFTQLTDRPDPCGLVIKPSLVTFATGAMEFIEGGSSMAEVALRLKVYGPQEASGKRSLLHDQIYGDRQQSAITMMPTNTFVLAGKAVRNAMGRVLAGLDGSNVARSGVPLAAIEEPGAATGALAAPGGR